MSYTKRARGLRRITVQGTTFRWRFSPKERAGLLAVYGPTSGRQPLSVTLRGWHDPWLGCPAARANEPAIIRPKFVRRAILYGLANGWLPGQVGAALCVDYENGSFSVRQNDRVRDAAPQPG